MAEKKIAKVTLNGEKLIDISEDTVTPEVLAESETAHDRSGEGIVGTAQFGGDTSDCYKTTDAVGTIDDADYIPFNDVSDAEVPKKKTLFSAIVDKLKTVFAQKTDLKTHSYEVGTEIPSNADLDDYTTEGVFYIKLDSVASTIANTPVDRAGKVLVVGITDANTYVQQIFVNNMSYERFIRIYNPSNSSWSDWKQLATTDDISPSSVGDGYAEGTVNGSAITATISGFKLRPGVIVAIKINNEISVACTLNINSTGAKSVKYWGNEDPTIGKPIGASRITTFMYDGTYYRVLSKDRTPAVGQQSYVADTSGSILLDWGYGVNRAQLKHNIQIGKLLYNYYKNGAWRGDKQVVDVTGNQTMEGWLKLPAGNGMTIASGAHAVAVQDTIPNIINELRFSNGAWGSFNLGTAYTLNQTTIPTGWYNYFYIPHRVGGENWATPTTIFSSDNVAYGTLMLFGMNNSNGMFRIRWHLSDSAIQIDELENLQKGNMYVGTCTTAADQKEKVATVDGNFVLRKGVRVAIKFTNTNTYSSSTANPITLNVNNTGAKNIWYGSNHTGASGGPTGTANWVFGSANRYCHYVYDGTYWVWDGSGTDNNTTYSNQSLGNGYGICDTAAATAAKVVAISNYNISTGGYVSIRFVNDVPANATLNINSRGAKSISYRNALITAGKIKAGDVATFIYDGTYYRLVGIDRWGGDETNLCTDSANQIAWSDTMVNACSMITNGFVRFYMQSDHLLIGSVECTYKSTAAVTLPAYSNDSSLVLFRFKNTRLSSFSFYAEVIVDIAGNLYPAFVNVGTINNEKCLFVALRKSASLPAAPNGGNIRFTFTTMVNYT